MSLLTMVQNATDALGIPRPSAVVGSSDQQIKQILSIANIAGKSLARKYRWSGLVKEFTHTTTAAEDQGAVTSVIGSDFDYLISSTVYNRSLQDFIGGPLSPRQWQMLKSSAVTGPYPDFRIRGGKFLMIPTPQASKTLAGEYYSKNWCQSSSGTGQAAWAADADTGVLSEDLMELGLVWRWLRAKGFDYSEEFRTYEAEVNQAYGRDGGGRRTQSLDVRLESPITDVSVPAGSWDL